MQENSRSGNKTLLEHWKEKWQSEAEQKELNVFFELYQEVYQFAERKNKSNKKSNYIYKFSFLAVLAAGFGFYMWFLIHSFREEQVSFANLGFVLLAFIWMETIISKWMDIKKYQETWARHSWHLHMMNQEMLRFISRIEPYDNAADKAVFMKRIMEIWDKNQEKFVSNIEEKEKGLMDVFENIKVG